MRAPQFMLLSALLASGLACGAGVTKPPAAPIKPVTETLWGHKVTDNYRYMEALDPETIAWMKAEGAYTRSVLDSIAPLAKLKGDVAKFSASFGLIQGYVRFGGRSFYQERAPGSDDFDLMVADSAGTRKIVDVAALRAAHGGQPYAINYFLASPDGARVAVGVSEGGSEDASITVYDAAKGAKLAGPIDRAQFGATAWSDDSQTLYFVRLKKLAANDPTDRKVQGQRRRLEPEIRTGCRAGSKVGHGPAIGPNEFPVIVMVVGAPMAAFLAINGVQNEIAMWLAPADKTNDPKANWMKFLTREDEVTNADMRGSEIFLLSHKDAPTFKVLSVRAGQPLKTATTLVPAQPERVIESIHAASDALYVFARKGAYTQLLRVPTGTHRIEEVKLPFEGHVNEAFTDPRVAGTTIILSDWVTAPASYLYDPSGGKFTQLKIGTHGDMDSSEYAVRNVAAKTPDGVAVPLALFQSKVAKGSQVTIIEAYGSYGISQLADFSIRRAAAVRQGITYGVCAVRGGGELGEAWRLGGKDANKHHTWEDIIACGEYAVAHGITTPQKLFIIGGSAGGITMGAR